MLLALGAAGLGLWWWSRRGTSSKGAAGSAGVDGYGSSPPGTGAHAVIDELAKRQARDLQSMRAYWNLSRLKAATHAASKAWGVPPQWVWGMIWRESGWRPVGLYGNSAAKAKAVAGGEGSTAFGVGQMLGSRFRAEKAWANQRVPGSIPWTHADLIDPRAGIWAVAASIRRAIETHGPEKLTANGGRLLGAWWTGSKGNWARKAGDIAKRGPNVWQKGAPSGWTNNQPGAVTPGDKSPPKGATTPNLTPSYYDASAALASSAQAIAEPYKEAAEALGEKAGQVAESVTGWAESVWDALAGEAADS